LADFSTYVLHRAEAGARGFIEQDQMSYTPVISITLRISTTACRGSGTK
jgi:hypothetical protein